MADLGCGAESVPRKNLGDPLEMARRRAWHTEMRWRVAEDER